MNEHSDPRLAILFEREHQHLPEEPFVGATLTAIRNQRRALAVMRNSLRIGALMLLIAVSPWLIDGAASLNAALESSFAWAGETAGWALALLAAGSVLAMRLRSR